MKALAGGGGRAPRRDADERDAQGHRLVPRDGRGEGADSHVWAGTLEVRAPRVNDKRMEAEAERQRFTSRILPPYMRRSPRVAEVPDSLSARVVHG